MFWLWAEGERYAFNAVGSTNYQNDVLSALIPKMTGSKDIWQIRHPNCLHQQA